MRFESPFAHPMPIFHLTINFFLGVIPPWKKMDRQIFNICVGKIWANILIIVFLRQHKRQRHHDKSHVMMPSAPLSHLIVRHTASIFGVLKCPLNPVSLPLHPHYTLKASAGVGERNLDIRAFPDLFGRNNMPPVGTNTFPILKMDGLIPSQKLHPATESFPKIHRPLLAFGNGTDNFTNTSGCLFRLISFKCSAPFRPFPRDIWRRIIRVYKSGGMNFCHKGLIHLCQADTKTRSPDVSGIYTDASILQAISNSILNDLKGKLNLCGELPLIFVNSRFLTSLRISGKIFRNKQPGTHRRYKSFFRQSAKTRNLSRSTLPRRPSHCRGVLTDIFPCLAKGLSLIISPVSSQSPTSKFTS